MVFYSTFLVTSISLAYAALDQKTADPVDVIFKVLGVAGAILAALGGLIGYFLTRYWAIQDRKMGVRERALASKDADRAKLRDILYQSLKWFEGGTQNRSIGIAVVRTSWEAHPEFQSLWIEVLANQVIYLLAAQEPKVRNHEYENLRRMTDILVAHKSLLNPDTRRILCETIAGKTGGQITQGLPLTTGLSNSLKQWKDKLECSN